MMLYVLNSSCDEEISEDEEIQEEEEIYSDSFEQVMLNHDITGM